MRIVSNSENNKPIEPLNDKDLVYMGKQIKEFVNVYLNNVTINNDEDFKRLQVLSMISDALLKRNYQSIINDTSLIVVDDNNAESNDIDYEYKIRLIGLGGYPF